MSLDSHVLEYNRGTTVPVAVTHWHVDSSQTHDLIAKGRLCETHRRSMSHPKQELQTLELDVTHSSSLRIDDMPDDNLEALWCLEG